MIESVENSEKCKIKLKKSTDMKISLPKKKRRPLNVHNEIKNEECMFCDDVIQEKLLKDVVKGNIPVGYLWKADISKEHPQYVAQISDEECSPSNVFHQRVEVKDSLKGVKCIATPVDTNAKCSQVLNANNKANKIHITARKKIKNSKHKKKIKQKICLKQLKRNAHSYVKFAKKIGKRCRNNEPLRVTTVDENLPYGWKKCAVQRKGGSSVGKWDVFYISPQGRKFRSRNELVSHLKDDDARFQKNKCDFSLHKRKGQCKPTENDHRAEEVASHRYMSSASNNTQNQGFESEPQKRIKTLLPRIRTQEEEKDATQMCMIKAKELSETSIGKEDCLSTTLGIQAQLKCLKSSSSSSSVFQADPENSQSAASFVPLSKTDTESGENWMPFSVTAEEQCQYADETELTRRVKSNVSKEADISSVSSEYDNLNLEETHTEEFLEQEPIRCLCGMTEEDGLMIQCDVCQCWQHALCNDIMHQDDVPQHFVCYFCHHPGCEQQSVKHFEDQDWLYKGQLPSLSFVKNDTEKIEKCEATLATAHHLLAELCYMKDYLHCIRVKTAVAQTSNHPKLILWNKNEINEEQQDTDVVVDVTGTHNGIKVTLQAKESTLVKTIRGSDYPQPEAAIDFSICQKKLLEHLHESHNSIEKKLNDIEEKFQDLEKEFISSGYEPSEINIQHAIKSMLKDLEKICLMCKYL